MSNYEIKIVNRHILIETSQGLILIDSGSPTTFQRNGLLELCDTVRDVATSCMGVDADYISEKVGADITGLIGMDIIGQYDMWINSKKFGNSILFYEDDYVDSFPIESFNLLNCPGVVLNINGRPAHMLFDTGAPISYIKREYLEGLSPCGHATDFTPIVNNQIEVDLYSVNCNLATNLFDINIASTPDEISFLIKSFGVDGIIGYDLIDNFRIILHKGTVVLPPQGI